MTDHARILALLELMQETGCTAEEACRDDLDLLPEVKQRWARLTFVEAQIDAAFPSSNSRSGWRVTRSPSAELPRIPGYNVERLLGHGGMGVVYRARHEKLNRMIALKMLLTGEYASENERTRFLREAEAVASLRHANIVQVHDVGEHDGKPYFTMEFVEGGTLADQLASTPQPARVAAATVATLARAMQVAHDGGIVHRDLKPSNVLLTADGTPMITDFGLAQRFECDSALTLAGTKMGSPSYMAPEQARGEVGAFCPLVDVYGLGAILYEMVTGRPPFRAESAAETQRQVVAEDPALPSRLNVRVPCDVETICMKCLQKEPQRRYATAADLADDLQRFLNDEPILARPMGQVQRTARWVRRHPQETSLAIAIVLLLVVIAAFGLREWNLALKRQAEMANWIDRLAFITQLQQEGRFTEVRAILDRVPDGGSSEIRTQIEQAKRDLVIVEQLDAIRMNRGTFVQGGGIDYDESARAYETVFRDQGFGALGEPPEEIAARLISSPIRAAIISALDDWSACALAEPRAWILSVAKCLDPDPWRDRVRDQSNWASLDHLSELASIAEVEEQPVTIMVAMGTRWRRLGGDPTDFLLRVQRRHPNDFWVNFELGHLLGVHDTAAAIGFNRAAIAVRPRAAAPHYNIANCFQRMEQLDGARYHYEQAVAIDPRHTWALRGLAYSRLVARRYDEAIIHFDRAFALDPLSLAGRDGRIAAYILSGRGDELKTKWARTLEDRPMEHNVWDGFAELCLYLGDLEGYERACMALLDQFGKVTDPFICERTGRACLLTAVSTDQLQRATRLIDRALAEDLTQHPAWTIAYFELAKAFAEYRGGQFARAVELLQGDAGQILPPIPQLLLAMSQHQLGDLAGAQQSFDAAMRVFDWRAENATNREAWMAHILRLEVEALIGSPTD